MDDTLGNLGSGVKISVYGKGICRTTKVVDDNVYFKTLDQELFFSSKNSKVHRYDNPDAIWELDGPFEPAKQWKRANYVPAPQYYLLNQACVVIEKAFNSYPYLVGSAIERRDFRDVDVRLILMDEEYDRLFKSPDAGWTNALWSLMCTSISEHLSKASGLPIDFQIQRMTQANEAHHGRRDALGMFLDYPGERPTDVVKPA